MTPIHQSNRVAQRWLAGRGAADPGSLGAGLRLLHVTEAPEGGVLTYLANLVGMQACSPDIAYIDVLGPAVNEAAIRKSSGGARVGVYSIPYETRSIGVLLRLAIATLRLVARNRPNIVHIHSTLAGFVVRLCLLPIPGRPKLIYTPHAWSFNLGAGRFLSLRRTCERWLAHWTDRIVCVSEDERRLALEAGISAQRCTVVLSGIPYVPSAPSAN